MPNRDSTHRDSGLSMALTKQERKLLDKAAASLGFATSVWARPLLLRAAALVLNEPEPAQK